ncbi:sugar ABC transporter substrate-binding protein [Nordella sp. HKS 07]|uniref:substrate-binding domain-containing protein n=1 Tax=Nordella sp. HKS 07 TaxID=2712222 RepID=UPI0013E1A9C4|nr:substrate-binding domain-containing protein [Nordella sp. HKS 07]QIG50167.1 sugar ABC transporter substrate-binding protein [Nordella sp. HKS 07]
MKHLGKLFLLGAFALMTVATAHLPAAAKDLKIGVVNLSLCCSYFVGMDQAIKDEAKVFPNVTVLSTDAKGDAAKLTSNVEDLLSQKVDGLIVSAAWIEAAPEALDAIKAAGVPVVLVDRMLKGGDFTSWIGPDNYAIGVGIGQYIVKRLNGQGLVVVLRGGPADNSIGLARTDGMLSEVEKAGIKVEAAPDFGGWSVDGGFKLMEDMLTKHPQISAVFCENDSMCQGAQKAIKDAGRSGDIFLASVDGEKGTLKEIMTEGTNYAATGLNNSDQIGRAGFHRLMAILAGAQAPKETVLPSPIITKDNAEKFYNPDSVF